MWDFSDYELRDLFRIRDCWEMLKEYGLENEDGLSEVNRELERRCDNGNV
jgi:hypothetical protein